VGRFLQTKQLSSLQPSFLFLMSMNIRSVLIGTCIASLVFLVPINVHAQSITDIPPPLFQPTSPPPAFEFGQEQLLRQVSEPADFGWRLKIIGEEILEFLTFDPLEKAKLKLQFAQERQIEIEQRITDGLSIPPEFEQRRIQKLNEAIAIFNERDATTILPEIIQSIQGIREMAEFNEVKVLYSQLETVLASPQEVKDAFNDRVNSLDAFQENCIGEFDVNDFRQFDLAFEILEEQCPRLVELEDQFGRERLRMLVTGQR